MQTIIREKILASVILTIMLMIVEGSMIANNNIDEIMELLSAAFEIPETFCKKLINVACDEIYKRILKPQKRKMSVFDREGNSSFKNLFYYRLT